MELSKLQEAFDRFDQANREDPNTEVHQGQSYPKELLYAQRMTQTLQEFEPNASEALQLAARCQHICRWEIPRESYEMNRVGYLKWRQDLKKYHAEKAASILKEVGYDPATIDRVQFLVLKKQLKRDDGTQTLEDVVCLVFLRYYFEPFMEKHPEEKIIEILQKTWKKMSERGKQAALEMTLSSKANDLIKMAVGHLQ